ncbi:MAG: TlpA family protein disulfide reductase [Bacteroidia bacterium]|nr:TlpA family protein disulfide reductase [Bacteroidia bacterium]
MNLRLIKVLLTVVCLTATMHAFGQGPLNEGPWRALIRLNDTTSLPFNFTVFSDHLEIINADEKIIVDEIKYSGDSVFIKLPVFDTEIRCQMGENLLDGQFINHSRPTNNILKFRAESGIDWRFSSQPEPTTHDISGRWHVIWDKEDGENKSSVAIFNQKENHLTGTFLTNSGDYRFLEGEVSGSNVSLSGFDASHAYLFNAVILFDGSLNGNFYSGVHWHDTWTGWKNDAVQLTDPESLTFLKPGYDRLAFTFPDENGKRISLTDPEYLNKIIVVQIMGTWCSNCLDETKYLVELYERYPKDKFKIIALDYERISDSEYAFKNIKRLKERLNIQYPIVYAGSSKREEAAKSLPMLSRIASYPTTIVIDKKGVVRKIHTGFNGPATGDEYEKFTNDFSGFIEKLLVE